MVNIEKIVSIAAFVHFLCILILVVFHSFLIAGKPWGHLTMGGQFQGELPKKMKIFSAISILILFVMASIVEVAAGNFFTAFEGIGDQLIIMVVIFGVIQVILHIITPSKWERILWLPLITVMLACSTTVWWLG